MRPSERLRSLLDIVVLAAVAIAGLLAGVWDRVTGRARAHDPVPVWPEVGWAREIRAADGATYLAGWTSDGDGGIYVARASVACRSKREARALILERLALRVAVARDE